MTALTAFFVFALGLCIGSFCNVCVYRIPRGESIVRGRSHCTSCGAAIKNRDLVPVLSWLWLRGRCRNCGAPISPRYPAVELAGAAIFTVSWVVCGLTARAAVTAALLSVLLIAALIDADTREIPNGLIAAVFAVGAVRAALSLGATLPQQLIGCAAAGLPLLAAALLSRGGMGLGDVKLAAACGFALGWKGGLLALLIGCVSGAVWALAMVAAHRKTMRSSMPLGPFLAAGAAVSALFGEPLLNAYLGLFVR